MFQPGLLAGKKILVTGGGTGLGATLGRRFVELGAELVICGRRLEVLEETAAASGATSTAPSRRSAATSATQTRSR
jgi:short-subunit dehydrogenase involved in D-alanine esterification of teichoic acids